MREPTESIGSAWQPDVTGREENEITQPIRIVCSRKQAPRNSRARRERMETGKTLDWTEIGDLAD